MSSVNLQEYELNKLYLSLCLNRVYLCVKMWATRQGKTSVTKQLHG